MFNKDDMFVVIYKILYYIYHCNKNGYDVSKVNHNVLNINERYYNNIVEEIESKKYIDRLYRESQNEEKELNKNVKITSDGVLFLETNEHMKKIGEMLKDRKELEWWL